MFFTSPKRKDNHSGKKKSYPKPKPLNFFIFLILLLLIVPYLSFADDQQGTSPYSRPIQGDRFGAGGVIFVRSMDLKGDGAREIVVGMKGVITRAEDFPDGLGPKWLIAPGEVYIFERTNKIQEVSNYHLVFQARDTLLQEAGGEVYSPLPLRKAEDIDTDGLPELVIDWAGEGWGPTHSPYALTVLQFDPDQDGYSLTFDPTFEATVRDGFVLKDVDEDQAIEVIKFSPNPSEIICHYCESPYRITVYEFNGKDFIPDPSCNGGKPFTTEEKYRFSIRPKIGKQPPWLGGHLRAICGGTNEK